MEPQSDARGSSRSRLRSPVGSEREPGSLSLASARTTELQRLIPFQPVFSILCQGSDLECGLPLRVPGGRRLHLSYAGGRVLAKEGGPLPKLNGRVLSGCDWLLLREDGVLVFDGRLTLGSGHDLADIDFDGRASRAARIGDTLDVFLVSASLSGMVDLDPARQRGAALRLPPAGWEGLTTSVRVMLPMRFGGSGPRVSWAKPRFRALAENFPTYGLLVQNQFLAIGEVTFTAGLVSAVTLDVGLLGGRDA